MAIDSSLLLNGEVSLFIMRQDDLTDSPRFAGLYGYSVVDGLTKSLGDVSPVQVPDPQESNKFKIVRTTRSAPDLGEISINERISRNQRSMLEETTLNLCDYAFFIRIGQCSDPDILEEFDSLILVSGATPAGDFDMGTLSQFDTNDPVEVNIAYALRNFERVFPVQLGEIADSILTTKVVDVFYGGSKSCGACAAFNAGANVKYALTDNAPSSAGLSSQLVYTKNGSTYNSVDIATLGGNSANAGNEVGRYVLVVSESDEAHHYINKSSITSAGWTKVTGYESGGGGRNLYAVSSQEIYVTGAGGYIYKITNITAEPTVIHDASVSTEDGNDIMAVENTIVSVHDNDVTLISQNGGASWFAGASVSAGNNLTTVHVINKNQWYIGTSAGELFYTVDGGETYTERVLPSMISAVNDITFSIDLPLIGAMAVTETTESFIYRTLDGGRNWFRDEPFIRNITTAPSSLTSVAISGFDYILTGGEVTSGGDGILLEAGIA